MQFILSAHFQILCIHDPFYFNLVKKKFTTTSGGVQLFGCGLEFVKYMFAILTKKNGPERNVRNIRVTNIYRF